MGSALHEAALFGKTDVVQILLAAGEDGSTAPACQAGPETRACACVCACDQSCAIQSWAERGTVGGRE